MAIKEVVKVNRRTFLDPRGWMGYDILREQSSTIFSLAKSSMSARLTPTGDVPESFADAMRRQKVSEKDLTEIGLNYQFYTWLFMTLSLCCVGAALYFLFVHFAFVSFILSAVVSVLFAVQAFRYNFWHFQIKHRKLGCTFAEWRQGKIVQQ